MQTAISKVSLLIAVIRYALSALLSHTGLGAFSSLLLSLMPTVPLHRLELDLLSQHEWKGEGGEPELLCPLLAYVEAKPSGARVFCTLNYVLPPPSLLAVSYDLGGVLQTGRSQTV